MQVALIKNIPPGGWRYEQEYSGDTIVIEEGGLDELQDAVTRFRVENKMVLGDVRRDIQEFISTRFPLYAGSVSAEIPERDFDLEAKNLRERWTNRASVWYSLRAAGNTVLLEQEEAETRAEICAQCPHNVQVSTDCASCVQNTARTLFLVSQGQRTSQALGVCDILGHDNNSAAFMPEVMLKYTARFQEELPSFCPYKK